MENRVTLIQAAIVLATLTILLRLAYMQLVDKTYHVRADATAIVRQVVQPARGLVYDREGRLMVYNQPVYDIYVTAAHLKPTMDTTRLCAILGIDRAKFELWITKDFTDYRFSRNLPFLFAEKLDAHVYARLQEILHEYPGFSVGVRSTRGYIYPGAAHVLGYLSEVDQRLIDQGEGYERRDYYGVTGIEATYETQLRGTKGAEYLLRDNFGRKVGSHLGGRQDVRPTSGSDVVLSLDAELQTYAEKLMAGKSGSVVAIEPATGEVLVLVSNPSYDPSMLSAGTNRPQMFRALQQDTTKPFFNRALQARYPPGSIFKPVLALIALQEGVLKVDRFMTCRGGYFYKQVKWGCHAGPGVRNVVSAIQQSCNTFFYTTYSDLVNEDGFDNPEIGLDHTVEYLNRFGLGKSLYIDLPAENSGSIPGSEYYDDLYLNKGRWRSTYIISNGIGQGEIELTPLQMANLAAIIANRGYYYRPHVLKGLKDGALELPEAYRKPQKVGIDDQHFDPVIEGMSRSVSMGTSRNAHVPGSEVCGKTGTSENPHGKDHSVFFAFAPREQPKIAIAVFVENGGWGGTYAAPIAGLVMEYYLNGEIDRSKQWLEDRILNTSILASF